MIFLFLLAGGRNLGSLIEAGRPLTGDSNPPAYPVFNVHVEIPPQPITPPDYVSPVFAYEAEVDSWRANVERDLSDVANYTSRLLKTLLTRDTLISTTAEDAHAVPISFLQGMPNIGEALKKTLLGGFEGGFQGEVNIGPIPVVNVFMEDHDELDNLMQETPINRSNLKKLIKHQKKTLEDMKHLLKLSAPSAFLQQTSITPQHNYVESNPPPYSEFDFFPAVTPAYGGKKIPGVFPPGATLVAETATNKVAGTPDGVLSGDTALFASLPLAAQKLKLRVQLEALIAKLKLVLI